MTWTCRFSFPIRRKWLASERRRFSASAPQSAWREMAAMMAFGLEMVRTSPRRAEIERRMQDQEEEWRRIQRELFARYGG